MTYVKFEDVYDRNKFIPIQNKNLLIDIDCIDEYNTKIKKNISSIPSKTSWNDKRVLVTGADGMVGSTIIDTLINKMSEKTHLFKDGMIAN